MESTTTTFTLGAGVAINGISEVKEKKQEGSRFSGADWADQLHDITLIGVGGIGSWLALNLTRIGHNLYIFDPDTVDESNVAGGQMYRRGSIGQNKANEVTKICREFGHSNNRIYPIDNYYYKDSGTTPIVMTGLDNMGARKEAFEAWKAMIPNDPSKYLLIDGRLLMESAEILCVQGNKQDDIAKYEKEYLFSDDEVPDLDCTTKQTTFGAMLIASMMTATLCNWLTNKKIGEDFREVPFYQRFHLPIMDYKKEVV